MRAQTVAGGERARAYLRSDVETSAISHLNPPKNRMIDVLIFFFRLGGSSFDLEIPREAAEAENRQFRASVPPPRSDQQLISLGGAAG